MAHEITKTDGLVLTGKPAWHGLGMVVEQAPTPTEGLKLAGLDWQVEQSPLSTVIETPAGMVRQTISTHVANYRSDTKEVLAVVGKSYVPVQNQEIAAFAEALAEGDDVVKLESVGSIRSGRKVWMLLRGESFSVRSSDEIRPYLLLANGHDCSLAFKAVPTSVRVVCSNTLHAALPNGRSVGYVMKHTTNVMSRVEEAKRALKLYGHHIDRQRELMNTLAAKEVTRQQIQDFWLESYQRDFGAIPTKPKTGAAQRTRDRALDAVNKMAERFDREKAIAGTTAWNAFNAYSGWVQHDRKTKIEAADNNLFGKGADRTMKSFVAALNLTA